MQPTHEVIEPYGPNHWAHFLGYDSDQFSHEMSPLCLPDGNSPPSSASIRGPRNDELRSGKKVESTSVHIVSPNISGTKNAGTETYGWLFWPMGLRCISLTYSLYR